MSAEIIFYLELSLNFHSKMLRENFLKSMLFDLYIFKMHEAGKIRQEKKERKRKGKWWQQSFAVWNYLFSSQTIL